MDKAKRQRLAARTKQRAYAACERLVGTPSWIEATCKFNHTLLLIHPSLEDLFDQLVGKKVIYSRQVKLQDLSILLGNLFLHKRHRPVRIALNRTSFIPSRYAKAGYFTIDLVNMLEKRGMIEVKRGFKDTSGKRRQTRIWPTQMLLEWFPDVPPQVIVEPVELVELRDENKILIQYTDTQRTRGIRKILETANGVNGGAEIVYGRYKLNPTLYAIFRRKFTLYGRLHTRGYRHYQGLGEDQRSQITINGELVVELDYSGLHPRMLYAAEGIQYDGDPYSAVDDRPQARPFLKIILLSILDSENETKAESAANFWLRDNHEEREALADIGITRARPLIDAFKEAHAPIAHYFCQGGETGLKLMNKDSKIALAIVGHFANRQIPILAVHDSFIVQAKYGDALKEVMDMQYRKHTGFSCPIK